jgi:hypothetical protein
VLLYRFVALSLTTHMLPAMFQYEMDLALGVIIGALFLGGLAPTRFIYSSVKDEQPRPLFDDIPALLGRLSCIGLGATILAEAVTGKVPTRAAALACKLGLTELQLNVWCKQVFEKSSVFCRVSWVSCIWKRARSR